ncbi:chromosomal replication initiator protein DnaA [Candidatus Dependentiae bacterium]|nr:chromosomal replication initiator protein DnaA [Candidatus Dependentiae bacterium]
MNVMIDHAWQDFLKIIRDEVGTRIVETWIKAVHVSYFDALKKELYITAPNLFVKNWVEAHYKDLFKRHFIRILGVDTLTVFFTLETIEPVVSIQEVAKVVPAIQASDKKKRNDITVRSKSSTSSLIGLNQAYQFETFIIGENNQFAYASARAVAEKLGSLYNPLLLYGPSGLGKTHLLHAIGNYVQSHHPELSILYQTTDRFVTEFINAVRFDSVSKFQAKYKNIDLLLIDDIQFMVGKEQTQEIFFQIFNSLYEANKQIVLSCDVFPRYLGGLVDRLKTRLEWGLVADVQIPTITTKIAILKRKAYEQREVLPEEVAFVIAQQDIASVRELEGALIRVLAYATLTNQALTVDLVKKVLLIRQETNYVTSSVDFKIIVDQVKKYFSYDVTFLRSKDRTKAVSLARHVAMYLMKRYTNASLSEIGKYLERNDHTTIGHAINRITKLRNEDENFSKTLRIIEEELRI